MKKFTVLLVLVSLLFSFIGCSEKGEESRQAASEGNSMPAKSDVIEIYTEEQLFLIGDNLSGNYLLKNDITLTKKWKTVGDSENAFEGIFDGNGHTVYNMEVVSDIVGIDGTSVEYMVGMFGVLKGTVKNLNIDTLSVKLDSAAITNTEYLSLKSNNPDLSDFDIHVGLAGLNKGNIRNVSIKVDYNVIPECEGARIRIGGIAGKSNDEISDCRVNGKIRVQNLDGYVRAGGIAGYVSSNGEISNSEADIDILAEITKAAKMNLGGLVGNLHCGIISKCVAKGTVKGVNTEEKATLCGGLIGVIDNCDRKYDDMSATVEGCCSSVDVISKGGKGYAAGFIGQIDFADKITLTDNLCLGSADGQKSSFGFLGRIQDVENTKLGISDFSDGNYNDIIVIKNNKSINADVFAQQADDTVFP